MKKVKIETENQVVTIVKPLSYPFDEGYFLDSIYVFVEHEKNSTDYQVKVVSASCLPEYLEYIVKGNLE